MCNLNIVHNKGNKDTRKAYELINTISFHSFIGNSDGDGHLIRSKQGTSIIKAPYKNILRTPAHLIVSHQRYATSGLTNLDKYAHPFETDDLVVFHNGVLTGVDTTKHSDTYMYAKLLQECYIDEKSNMLKALNKTHKNLSGSFSVFIYDKINERLYYVKNSSRTFYYINTKKHFVGSTVKENTEYAKIFLDELDAKVKVPINLIVYDVLNNFTQLGKLKTHNEYTLPKTTGYTELNKKYYSSGQKVYVNKFNDEMCFKSGILKKYCGCDTCMRDKIEQQYIDDWNDDYVGNYDTKTGGWW